MLIDVYLGGLTIGLLSYELIRLKDKILTDTDDESPYVLRSGKIKFNMRLAPHILVAGLSGQGKTRFVESLLIGRDDIDIVLLNVFRDDMRGIKARRINTLENIKNFLENVLRSNRTTPLYIIIDELLSLSIQDKTISKTITKLLAVARHFNVFLICISQSATKEEVGSKMLFNTRVCFKQVESSQYQVVLGYTPEDKKLQQREYYYISTETGKGKVPILK